jgi:hypothetical protein
MAVIRAKYPAMCKSCQQPINIGDLVTKDGFWKHVDCPGLRPVTETVDTTPRCRMCHAPHPAMRCVKCGAVQT